jgi:cytochrome c biogenesis protein
MIEDSVAVENQESVADSYIKIIYFLAESMNQKLITDNLVENDFFQDALNAYSDSFFYGDSPFLILNEYQKIYASGMYDLCPRNSFVADKKITEEVCCSDGF